MTDNTKKERKDMHERNHTLDISRSDKAHAVLETSGFFLARASVLSIVSMDDSSLEFFVRAGELRRLNTI